MIAPDMATMLSFVFTDAPIAAAGPADAAQPLHSTTTFNAVTVDGDTSTSDTLLLFATGQSRGAPRISRAGDTRLADFRASWRPCCSTSPSRWCATARARASSSKITVDGRRDPGLGARSPVDRRTRPLVKTAIAGEDANWGRIVMAVGKAGEPADRDKLSICLRRHPRRHEGRARSVLRRGPGLGRDEGPQIVSRPLGLGKGRDRVLTCDLTKAYVEINGDYRS